MRNKIRISAEEYENKTQFKDEPSLLGKLSVDTTVQLTDLTAEALFDAISNNPDINQIRTQTFAEPSISYMYMRINENNKTADVLIFTDSNYTFVKEKCSVVADNGVIKIIYYGNDGYSDKLYYEWDWKEDTRFRVTSSYPQTMPALFIAGFGGDIDSIPQEQIDEVLTIYAETMIECMGEIGGQSLRDKVSADRNQMTGGKLTYEYEQEFTSKVFETHGY